MTSVVPYLPGCESAPPCSVVELLMWLSYGDLGLASTLIIIIIIKGH